MLNHTPKCRKQSISPIIYSQNLTLICPSSCKKFDFSIIKVSIYSLLTNRPFTLCRLSASCFFESYATFLCQILFCFFCKYLSIFILRFSAGQQHFHNLIYNGFCYVTIRQGWFSSFFQFNSCIPSIKLPVQWKKGSSSFIIASVPRYLAQFSYPVMATWPKESTRTSTTLLMFQAPAREKGGRR